MRQGNMAGAPVMILMALIGMIVIAEAINGTIGQ